MATKVFILANKNSAEFLEVLAKKLWNIFSEKDGRRSGVRKDNAVFSNAERYYLVKTIKDLDTFNKIDFKNEIKIKDGKHETVDKIFFFITPELFWKSGHLDEGYEYALDILNHRLVKDKNILQIRFLSALPFKNLLAQTRPHLKRMVEAFPFFDIIGEQERILSDLYKEYSPTHFHLIKKLAVSDTGYINYLLHDINGLINSSNPSQEKDRYALNCISGLGYLDGSNLLTDLPNKYTFISRADILKNCSSLLNSLLIRVDNGDKIKQANKYPYRVLVVEDDPSYRTKLKDMLAPFFNVIDLIETEKDKPFTQVLKEKIPKESENYEIIFLDLLYKNENGSWAEESGLDLYKNIKAKNRFCVTPIITSLPRAMVASLVKEVDETGIPYHLLFSKANGEDFLRLDLKDKLPDIIKTVQESEKQKKMFKPIPTEGIFKGLSVTSILLNLMKDEKGLYDSIANIALSLFNLFMEDRLSIDAKDWEKGKLPSPQTKDNINKNYLIKKLPSILTHRLMVIDFALKNENNIIEASDYQDKVMKESICNLTKFDKAYLNTKLGFNIKKVINGFKIEFKNFFPHEWEYISKFNINRDGKDLVNNYEGLELFFREVLMDLRVYEFIDIGLCNDYYTNVKDIDCNGEIKLENIKDNLSISDLENFLKALISKTNDDYFPIITQLVNDKSNQIIAESIPYNINVLLNKFEEIEMGCTIQQLE